MRRGSARYWRGAKSAGSVLLLVKAVATNLLSIGAALGAVVWVFRQGHLASWFGTARLDATHVSVPVLTMTLVGRYNWWAPGPLRRLHAHVIPQSG